MSISYWRSADTRELWSSNSFQSSCIGRPPIPGNYRHQIKFNHLVSAGHRYQGTMGIKLNLIISYRRAADTRKLWASNSFSSSRIGGPPIPGNYGSQVHLPHLVLAGRRYQGTMVLKFILLISYRWPTNTRELWFSSSFTSSRISGPPIPGNYGPQIHSPHLVSVARRYQGTMVIKFISFISYLRPADARELCSSISFSSSHIGGLPIPGNYCHQFQLHHLVSVARRYQWNSETSCWSLTFYRRIACRCRQIRSSLA